MVYCSLKDLFLCFSYSNVFENRYNEYNSIICFCDRCIFHVLESFFIHPKKFNILQYTRRDHLYLYKLDTCLRSRSKRHVNTKLNFPICFYTINGTTICDKVICTNVKSNVSIWVPLKRFPVILHLDKSSS